MQKYLQKLVCKCSISVIRKTGLKLKSLEHTCIGCEILLLNPNVNGNCPPYKDENKFPVLKEHTVVGRELLEKFQKMNLSADQNLGSGGGGGGGGGEPTDGEDEIPPWILHLSFLVRFLKEKLSCATYMLPSKMDSSPLSIGEVFKLSCTMYNI